MSVLGRALHNSGETVEVYREQYQDNGQGGGEQVQTLIDEINAVVWPASDSQTDLAGHEASRIDYSMVCLGDSDIETHDFVHRGGDELKVHSVNDHSASDHLEVELELIE